MIDVLIVGSGFGGAIPALTLTQAGFRVCLLERGPWRDTTLFKQAGIGARAPLPQGRHFLSHLLYRVHHHRLPRRGLNLHRHGLLELFAGHGVNVMCASGVGGGSHVYGGLHAMPLRENYWADVADTLDPAGMAAHYAGVRVLLGSRTAPMPSEPLGWQRGVGDFIHVSAEQSPMWGYRQTVDFSREGLFGSPDGNKVTLDAACLLPAMHLGLQVKDCHEVLLLRRLSRGGFEVTARNSHDGSLCTLQATRVIMAAGVLNTLSVLLRSRQTGGLSGMPALGQGFGTNADVMAYWPVNTPGADYPAAGIYQQLFRYGDDVSGPLFMQAGIAGLAAIPLPAVLKRRLRRDLFIACMGIDAADGVVSLERDRLQLRYACGNSPVFASIRRCLQQLGELQGRCLHAPGTPTTVHPLGGARVGNVPSASVVNGNGEVHDVPGLFVTDASALPAAPGSPPSLTIAAWARHVATRLAETL